MADEEIEKAVLYYIIYEQEEFNLTEKDFVSINNKKIIKAINELKGKEQEISILAINNKISDNKKGNQLKYLSDLGEYVKTTTAEALYKVLKENTKKREVFELSRRIENEVIKTENIDIDIEKYIAELQNIESQTEKEESFIDLVSKTAKLIEENINKKRDYDFYTGFFELDALTDGLHRGELTIIGARPGVGKTTFALQIADKLANRSKNVTCISLEMSEEQIIQKILSRRARVNSRKIRNGDLEDKEIQQIGTECGNISHLPITLLTKINTIQQIEIVARKMKNKEKLDLLIIDYLQLVKSTGNFKSREQEVADISRTLKLLSLELEIPIIALCQLNRNASRNEPTLADIRESGSIEQDADNVIFLYKEDEESNIVTVDLQKQRAGNTGKLKLKFNKVNSEFINVER